MRILDTPAEERFDRITRIAQKLFNVPIALVSLVDTKRQWFKSRVGLDAADTPRDISFCGHAILQPDIFFVPDASRDQRFVDNPLVTGDPKIQFYAGQPLRDIEGNKLGTLCLIDRRPRELDEGQRQLLHDLGLWAENELNTKSLGHVLHQLQESEQRYQALTHKAKELAQAMRRHVPVSLTMLDIDRFKSINDHYGHLAGDRVIKSLARLLQQRLRQSDVIGRYGGEEFLILMYDMTGQKAQSLMDKLRDDFAQLRHQASEELFQATFSCGIARFRGRSRHRP